MPEKKKMVYSASRMRINCPHCENKAEIRTSKTMSAISREIYFQCTNPECGHTWAALLSAIRTIVPSMTPCPSVYIPLSEKNHSPAALATPPPNG